MTHRIVCQFSCGAASAVATKLAIARYGHERIMIINAFVKEEDSDNRRFLDDCEKWFDHPVKVVRDTKYGASAREVWRRKRYMNGPLGASCSAILKREVIAAELLPDDQLVVGLVVDEKNQERIKRGLSVGWILPCIEANLTHADCRGIVERAGLLLPLRYRKGYRNANCKCCCKGGEKYMRKSRLDDPDDFAEVAEIEADIGPSAHMFYDRKTGVRYPLTQLSMDGPIEKEVEAPECSFFCAMAEDEIE